MLSIFFVSRVIPGIWGGGVVIGLKQNCFCLIFLTLVSESKIPPGNQKVKESVAPQCVQSSISMGGIPRRPFCQKAHRVCDMSDTIFSSAESTVSFSSPRCWCSVNVVLKNMAALLRPFTRRQQWRPLFTTTTED